MGDSTNVRLSFSEFIKWVDARRTRLGLPRLTDDEYFELYKKSAHLPPARQGLTRLEVSKWVEAGITASGIPHCTDAERRALEEELHRLAPETQQRVIDGALVLAKLILLNRAIDQGTASKH